MPNNGLLLIDKPSGMTSHDLVNIARKAFHTKKVGHNGTLDPDATGVMILCIGQATRLNEYLVADDKKYRATLVFGYETDTQDISGRIINQCDNPSFNQVEFEEILQSFLGEQVQQPPVYSAIKIDGKPLYQYAREGKEIPDIPKRQIQIFDIQCVSYNAKEAVIDIHCSKGTYVRTLCQDIARQCGSCGCMKALRRTAIGEYSLNDCVSVEVLKSADNVENYLIPMSHALSFPIYQIKNLAACSDLLNGKRICVETVPTELKTDTWVQAMYENTLISIGKVQDGWFVPKKVFHN